jgi:hypothetical protein
MDNIKKKVGRPKKIKDKSKKKIIKDEPKEKIEEIEEIKLKEPLILRFD